MRTTVLLAGTFLWAFTLQSGWLWFVAPLGVPAIGYWHCFGLMHLVPRLVNGYPDEKVFDEMREWSWRYRIQRSVVGPLLALAFFWLVSLGVQP